MSGKHTTSHTNDDNSNAGGNSYEEWRQDRIARADDDTDPAPSAPAASTTANVTAAKPARDSK